MKAMKLRLRWSEEGTHVHVRVFAVPLVYERHEDDIVLDEAQKDYAEGTPALLGMLVFGAWEWAAVQKHGVELHGADQTVRVDFPGDAPQRQYEPVGVELVREEPRS